MRDRLIELPRRQVGAVIQIPGVLRHAEHQPPLPGGQKQRQAIPLRQSLDEQPFQFLAVFDAPGAAGEPPILQLLQADEFGHRRPGLRALHRRHHIAVAGRHQLLEPRTAHRAPPLDGAHIVVVGDGLHQVGGQAFGHRHIHLLAAPAGQAGEQRGQRGGGGVGPGHIQRLLQSVPQRLPVGIAGVIHQPAHRAGDEVGGLKVAVRPGLPKGGDISRRQMGMPPGQLRPVEVQGGGFRRGVAHYHGVRRWQQPVEDGLPVAVRQIQRNAALAGVQIEKGDAGFGMRLIPGERPAAAQRVAHSGRLRLDDRRAIIRQQLSAESRRRPRPQLHHPQPIQQTHRHSNPPS